jgi:hypothetical protein
VPSVPTPFAGAVYVLAGERVHAVDVPFTQAIRTISRWGSGAGDLVAAMKTGPSVAAAMSAHSGVVQVGSTTGNRGRP